MSTDDKIMDLAIGLGKVAMQGEEQSGDIAEMREDIKDMKRRAEEDRERIHNIEDNTRNVLDAMSRVETGIDGLVCKLDDHDRQLQVMNSVGISEANKEEIQRDMHWLRDQREREKQRKANIRRAIVGSSVAGFVGIFVWVVKLYWKEIVSALVG